MIAKVLGRRANTISDANADIVPLLTLPRNNLIRRYAVTVESTIRLEFTSDVSTFECTVVE